MTLRQKLACVGLAVFGLQIASAAAGGAPLRDRLQRWFDPEQLLLASVRMELGAPPVAVSPTPEAAAALSAASPAPEVTPVPTADDDVETAPTATADGLPIVATSIAGGLTVKNETDIPVSVAALLQQLLKKVHIARRIDLAGLGQLARLQKAVKPGQRRRIAAHVVVIGLPVHHIGVKQHGDVPALHI